VKSSEAYEKQVEWGREKRVCQSYGPELDKREPVTGIGDKGQRTADQEKRRRETAPILGQGMGLKGELVTNRRWEGEEEKENAEMTVCNLDQQEEDEREVVAWQADD
jgi:hypothetical protein